jgi:hypothetical protein
MTGTDADHFGATAVKYLVKKSFEWGKFAFAKGATLTADDLKDLPADVLALAVRTGCFVPAAE